MSIESRMDEFKKVPHKEVKQDIDGRMEGFEAVYKGQKQEPKEKNSTLPYGYKRYKTCPHCGEIMEIHELKETEAIYICKDCKQIATIEIIK